MGEQEERIGAELVEVLWPSSNNQRKDATNYYIVQSARATLAASAMLSFATGEEVNKDGSEAAGVMIHAILGAQEAGRVTEGPIADAVGVLVDRLGKIAVLPPSANPEDIDFDCADILKGIADEALALNSIIQSNRGCFGVLKPQQTGRF